MKENGLRCLLALPEYDRDKCIRKRCGEGQARLGEAVVCDAAAPNHVERKYQVRIVHHVWLGRELKVKVEKLLHVRFCFFNFNVDE